eukprot:CAMPEP_0119328180 /NCGR_PEP_ID=MMETSP1333-20130426/72681_1 /TAXON_ID=418940 /ORGANISM="Scyphosphaera apsteinii, Strain RCC1455" /LENGTH=40 /DNA_ID= /DNA_START= /DNA_END= /DNA_ORIENTATION=
MTCDLATSPHLSPLILHPYPSSHAVFITILSSSVTSCLSS